MTKPKHTQVQKGHSAREQAIDRMVEDSFPASDATQLPGRAGDPQEPPAAKHDAARDEARKAPRTIGNQGVVPATRMREESLPLGAAGVVTLRVDAVAGRLSLRIGEDEMSLDAKALDKLIAALSTKRAQMAK